MVKKYGEEEAERISIEKAIKNKKIIRFAQPFNNSPV